MTALTRLVIVVSAMAMFTAYAPARADDAGASSAPRIVLERYPLRFIDRPLVIPNKSIRLDGAVRVDHHLPPSGNSGSIILGGAVSFLDNLEIGISPYRVGAPSPTQLEGALPLRFATDFEAGSIPVYARYGFGHGTGLRAALDAGVIIPLRSELDFGLLVALITRVPLGSRVVIDTGLQARIFFRDGKGVTEAGQPDDGDTDVLPEVPVHVMVQITDQLWAGARVGLKWPKFDPDTFTVAMGAELGYTFSAYGSPAADVFVRFDMPRLFVPNADVTPMRVNQEEWQLTMALRGYIDVARK